VAVAFARGVKLGPYELEVPVGSGGMGEVYRARDTRLGREVAIKVLPQSFASDADRLRRFAQEARAVAALNHPNIVSIFDVGECEGVGYLVSELLEGETLRSKIIAGALSSRRAAEYASQIADGLAAAHDKGIIHRDLKPENVFITKDGRVKILDFGLAKLVRANASVAGDGETSDGVTQTTPGFIVGTAGYMSPEQVRGRKVDARTDIFSLGAILYEMLSGQRAFTGQTSVEIMNSILKDDPPELDGTKIQVSPGLERILRRCLEKEPEHRFQSARDVKFAIEVWSGSSSSVTQTPLSSRHTRWWWPAIAAAAALIAIIAVVLAFSHARRAPAHALHFAVPVRDEITYLAISPDGTMLAFVSPDDSSGQSLLFVEAVGSETATPLPGTAGGVYPFWSPDNQYVGYFASGHLFKIRASGGPPQPLVPVTQSPRGGTWSSNGVIVYAPDSGGCLWRVNADGSGAAPVTDKLFAQGDITHRWPTFLPDGNHLLFYSRSNNKQGAEDGLYLTTLEARERKLVLATPSNASYAQPGYLFFADPAGRLFVRPFDLDKQELRGDAHVVLDRVGYQPAVQWASFSASENGTVVANVSSTALRSQLTWYDRTGKEVGTVGQAGILYNPALSPDGRRVAVDVANLQGASVNVWLHNTLGTTTTRFTFGDHEDVEAVWSPDGRYLAYRSSNAGAMVKAASGLEKERVVVSSPSSIDDVLPNSWSSDGHNLVCTVESARGGSQLYLVSVADGKMTQLISGKANHSTGQISPDGKWLAYSSDESGLWEVYVTSFPAGEGKWQVSQGGGTEPRWRGDGREIFYISAGGKMTAVPVTANSSFSSGSPQELFSIRSRPPISDTDLYSYDVSKDGQKFLVNAYQKPVSVPPLDIVLNATK
jgi:Tol biopolymer transport system component